MSRAEGQRPETRIEKSSQWFDILAYPQTPEGFRLNLVDNGPRTIEPRHKRHFGPIVEQTLREKTGTPGFHNATKINLHPYPPDPKNPAILPYNATPAQYVEFYTLSGKTGVPRSLQEQVRSSGVQVVWRTTESDGSHKFVFEVRSENSGLYPGFGGTIGGGIDGVLGFSGKVLDDRGTLQDASPQRIIDQAVQEAQEELGIGEVIGNMMRQSYDIRDGNLVVMGIGKDKKQNYFDVLCRGLLPLDQKTLQRLYEVHKAGGNDKIHDPMPKRLIFMDDTPDVYRKLLSSIVPLTPMTQAPLLLAGYMSKMEEVLAATGSQDEALKQATLWRKETVRLMQQRDGIMDSIARKERRKLSKAEWKKVRSAFAHMALHGFRDNVHELENAWHGAWTGARKRPRGLSTKLTPEQQGLPKTEKTLDDLLNN